MASAGDYDPTVTDLCERMLVTVIGNAGFWGGGSTLWVGSCPGTCTAAPAMRLQLTWDPETSTLP